MPYHTNYPLYEFPPDAPKLLPTFPLAQTIIGQGCLDFYEPGTSDPTLTVTDEPRNIQRFSTLLARAYLPLGPGRHSLEDVVAKTDLSTAEATRLYAEIGHTLPQSWREIVRPAGEDTPTHITFGTMALAMSVIPEARTNDPALPDHASVVVGEFEYHLPLTSAEALLAAHILDYVGALPASARGDLIKARDIASGIWTTMTNREKRVFTETDAEIDSSSDIILKLVRKISSDLLSRLHIVLPIAATAKAGASQFKLRPTDVQLAYHDEPLTAPPRDGVSIITHLSAYQPADELLHAADPGDARLYTQAVEALRCITSGTESQGLDTESAVRFVGILVQQPAQRAFLAAAREVPDTSPTALLKELEAQIKAKLGTGFSFARSSYYMSGWGRPWIVNQKTRRKAVSTSDWHISSRIRSIGRS